MQSEPVAKLSLDQYQAELKIPSPQISDAGMYICFVSDSSQANAWSYKSVVLKINPTSEERSKLDRMKVCLYHSVLTPKTSEFNSQFFVFLYCICCLSSSCLHQTTALPLHARAAKS